MDVFLIIEIILVFALLMFIHELGHFIFAKRAGIFVREFSLGLGPKIFSFKKKETQYTLRILPFGAYVRMAGEDPEIVEIESGQIVSYKLDNKGSIKDIFVEESSKDKTLKVEEIDIEHKLFLKGTDKNEKVSTLPISREAVIHYEKGKQIQIAPWDRQFGSKKVRQKFAAVLAGPVFNIILAVILFFSVALMIGVPTNQISVVNQESPAEESGLQKGDAILGIEGLDTDSLDAVVEKIQSSANEKVNLIVERNGEKIIVPVVPEIGDKDTNIALIGVAFGTRDATFTEAANYSIDSTVKMTGVIFEGFRMIFTGHVGMDDITGPVGIMTITSQAAKEGLANLTRWGAILSLYLGIFNLLPIPALDGSRLMFITFEGLRGRPIDPQKESIVHLIGFAFLMLLMVIVTFNDVSRLFQ